MMILSLFLVIRLLIAGFSNGVVSERLSAQPEEELAQNLYREINRPDYNLEEMLNDTRDCPGLYKAHMKSLGVDEGTTLLAFSNAGFFKTHELSYNK